MGGPWWGAGGERRVAGAVTSGPAVGWYLEHVPSTARPAPSFSVPQDQWGGCTTTGLSPLPCVKAA